MINLLPPAAKKQFTAGRVNALLARYIFITMALFALLAGLCGFTYITLQNSESAAQKRIDENASRAKEYDQVQQRATAFQSNLTTSKAILDQQTHYTDTILKISAAMPSGAMLTTLTLDKSTYGTPIVLQVNAKNEAAALQVKKNFQESGIFDDVHLTSIALGGTSGSQKPENADYPITAQFSVVIKKGTA